MPKRNLVLTTGEVYHVFNKSVNREDIFSFKRSLHKSFEIVNFYRYPQKLRLSKFNLLPHEQKLDYMQVLEKESPLVDIYSYAFMPNHYHILLKQISDYGVFRFISNFQNSFAKFYNLKNNRIGALFLNPFKSKRIETEEQLLHVSRYIHLNPVTSYLIEFKELANYSWTSFSSYAQGVNDQNLVNVDFISKMFRGLDKYVEFVSDQVNYQRELKRIRDLIIE